MSDRSVLLKERIALVPPGSSLLCSYPRSGSIWLRLLMYDINWLDTGHWLLRRGHPPRIHRFTPQLELPNFPRNFADTAFEWKLIKTHLPRGWTAPLIRKGRAIVLLRRPEDAFFSAYRKRKHERFKPNLLDGTTSDDRVERLESLGPDAYCLERIDSWRKYVEGYFKVADRNPGRVKFVTYEGLKADGAGTLASIMEFFERPVKMLSIRRALKNRDISREGSRLRPGYGKVNISSGQVGTGSKALSNDTLAELRAALDSRFQEVLERSQG